MRQIALINHGCAKNLIDSELMLGKLAQNGYKITLDETKADIVIINTCSFINDAVKESVASIFEMIDSINFFAQWWSISPVSATVNSPSCK